MGDLNQKKEFVLKKAQGKSLLTIASEMGLSKRTLVNWNRELKPEVELQRKLEMESLREISRISEQEH